MSKKKKKRAGKTAAKSNWRRRNISTIIAVFLCLLAGGFGCVWCRVQVVQLGYKLSEAHRIHTRLLNDSKKLHLELARLKAPERVERIAIEQLGLNRPRKEQIVELR
jgi:cell division protein FtsL